MKKVIAFFLVFSLVASCTASLACAEHVHKASVYVTSLNNIYGHSFLCKYCGLSVTEDHNFDENGNCECGYIDHEHTASSYPACNESFHMYNCIECKAVITENHTLNENGECVCGYMDHEHVARIYEKINSEFSHSFLCRYCGALITEDHKIDENGECPCGYLEHSHSADAYYYTDYSHLFFCTECFALVDDNHEIDEAGKCVCGYVDPDVANFFDVIFQPFTKMIAYFKLIISCFRMGFEMTFNQPYI